MRGEAMTTIYVPNGLISVPTEAVQRLEDWADWLRPRISYGRCASAEGRYDSKYPNEEQQGGIKHDLNAVLLVERVVSTRLPRICREIVRRHFVFLHEPRIITNALSIHRFQYGNELKRSVLMVKNNLTQF